MSNTVSSKNIITLRNGLIVDKEYINKETGKICHYVAQTVVGVHNSEEVFVLIFPNQKLLYQPDFVRSPEEGCFCPRSFSELNMCLSGCASSLNQNIKQGHSKIHHGLIIKEPLSLSEGTLDEDNEAIESAVLTKYEKEIQALLHEEPNTNPNVFVMNIV